MGGHALNPALFQVLWEAWANPFKTKSNFAKEHATLIGVLASEGMLTLRHAPWGTFNNVWRVTPEGLIQMWTYGESHKELITSHEIPPESLSEEQDQDSPH